MRYLNILANNGFDYKTFPSDKLPVVPFDESVRELRWFEGADTFGEMELDEDIPMEARVDNGIMYYGDNFLINDVFETPLLLTTQGMVTNNPNDGGESFLFMPYETFNQEVGLYQHSEAGIPLIRFAGDGNEITMTSKYSADHKPLVEDDEVIFIHKVIKYWINVANVTPFATMVPVEAYKNLKAS